MTVGGLFDAEDLYGPLHIYRTLEKNDPGIYNVLVMGPWSHGDWARVRGAERVGDITFGTGISDFYQRQVELPFFDYFLKQKGEPPRFEALVFDTGRKQWRTFAHWPPAEAAPARYYLRAGERLATEAPARGDAAFDEYVSDPHKPVPYTEHVRFVFTPRAYMAEDQRFAARRPDVLVFQTPALDHDVTLAGDLLAHLMVSTTGTDADWIVKLIDVYPDDTPNDSTAPGVQMGGYQQMVRSEILRGRFRNGFEHPQPFVPGQITPVEVPLQDVLHTFQTGHRIMVQVQSSWFPLFDRNPQRFVPNIFDADEADFIKATQRVYHDPQHPSWVEAGEVRGKR